MRRTRLERAGLVLVALGALPLLVAAYAGVRGLPEWFFFTGVVLLVVLGGLVVRFVARRAARASLHGG